MRTPRSLRFLAATIAVSCVLRAEHARAAPDARACIEIYESAQRERQAGHRAESAARFRACADAACPQAVRQECAGWCAEMERTPNTATALPPSTTLAASPAATEPLPETPRASEPASPIRGDAPETVPGTSSPSRVLPAIFAGIGVLGLGGFAYFGLRGTHERDDLKGCKGYCDADDVDRARLNLTLADVSLGVGLVALGAGAYFYFSGRPSSGTAVNMQLVPVVGGLSTAVGGRF